MRANGFTLVELMVVIALLALATGAVVLSTSGSSSEPRDSAARFAGRLAAARDEAIVSASPMQVWVSPSGYGFDRYRSGAWHKLDAKPFAAADWPTGTRAAALRVRFDSLGLPDGPAALHLSTDGASAEVRLDANGDVTVQ